MAMDAFEKIISDAMRFTDAGDPNKRMKVYQNVAKAIETVPEQKRELYRSKLSDFIRKYEAELQKNSADHQVPPSSREHAVEPATEHAYHSDAHSNQGTESAGNAAPDQTSVEPPTSDISVGDLSGEAPRISPQQQKGAFAAKRPILFGLIAILALLLAALIFFYFFQGDDGRQSAGKPEQQVTEPKSNTKNGAQVQSGNTVKTIFDISLPADIASVSDRIGKVKGDQEKLGKMVQDGNFTITELTTIFPSAKFPVDTSKTYLMKLEIIRPKKTMKKLVINAGLANFDKYGNVLRAKPGPHRYFLHKGRVKNADFAENGDMLVISGSITGVADASLDSFLPNTSAARAVVELRPIDKGPVTIKRISLVEIQ